MFIYIYISIYLFIYNSTVRIIQQQSTINDHHLLTFEREDLVPPRIEILPFDVRDELVLLVRQQHDLDVRVARAGEVLRRQIDGADDLQRQRHLLKVVAETELYPAELLRSVDAVAVGGGRRV